MPGIEGAVSEIVENERAIARASGARLVTLGVSIDVDVEAGLRMLRRFGPFDEVAVGRGWLNLGAYRYIWNDFPGHAGVPQVLISERRAAGSPRVELSGERVLYRRAGGDALMHWADEIQNRSNAVQGNPEN